jgi:Fe/S biogenesis protein NfuA
MRFTEGARRQIIAFRDDIEDLALRVRVHLPNPLVPEYHMEIVSSSEQEGGDQVLDGGGFSVLVDPQSLPLVANVVVDWVDGSDGTGFAIRDAALEGPADESGTLPERVQRVIDRRLNPVVATHGGHVVLVEIRDGAALLEMGGGCKGCGMAAVTLGEGIRRVLLTTFPELRDVVDVTDHRAGTDPFYTAGAFDELPAGLTP